MVLPQIAHLTLHLGALPLAFLLHGAVLGDPGNLALGDLQRSELLLMSSQSFFMAVVLARMSASMGGAFWLMALFLLQIAPSALLPDGGLPAATTNVAAVYLMAAIVTIYRDRSRLSGLLEIVPHRVGVPYRRAAVPAD